MGLLAILRNLFGKKQSEHSAQCNVIAAEADNSSASILKKGEENKGVANELTPEQRLVRDEIKRLAIKAKGLIESDWSIGTREEKYQKAVEALAALDEADRITEQCGFVDFTFVGRTECVAAMKRCRRWTQPLFVPSSDDALLVAILDTETTGLGEADEAITVGAILVEVKRAKGEIGDVLATYYGKREPSVSISPQAYAVHGIAMSELVRCQFDLDALQKITDSASLLIAHNAKFDRRMLAKVLPHLIDREWACSLYSLKHEWAAITGGRRSLDAICEKLGINRPAPHNALNDCTALLEVLKARSGKTNRSATLMGRLVSNAWAPPP